MSHDLWYICVFISSCACKWVLGNNHYLFIFIFNFDILFLLLVLCFVSLLCMWNSVQKRPKLTGLKKNPERMSWILLVFRWWQMFSNLEVTGVIGPADEEVMDKRRCACEDVMQKDEVMNPELQPQQFNLGKFWY